MSHPVIKVSSIDGKIWHPGPTAVDITSALQQHGKVVIDLLKEAPDICYTELPSIIDSILAQGYSASQIEIHTGNMVESYTNAQIVRRPDWMFELEDIKRVANQLPKEKQIQKHFGCLIGRSNAIRLIAAGHLYANYKDKTFLTYHYTPKSDYHRLHIGIQDIMYYFGTDSTEFREAMTLLVDAPVLKQTVQSYPILRPENLTPCTWYPNFFVDIVCETFCQGRVFFVTEKFWRAVATKTPFIIHGPQFLLQRLKQLGFKTFDAWWDEGYDQDPHLYSYQEINKVLKYLSDCSIPDLEQMYQDMQPILQHNYQCMMNLTFQDLLRVK
jgi:hypothetical protein